MTNAGGRQQAATTTAGGSAPCSTLARRASCRTHTAEVAAKAKPAAAQGFKFEYEDVRLLSDCKSECLELIYARSMDRGFASA